MKTFSYSRPWFGKEELRTFLSNLEASPFSWYMVRWWEKKDLGGGGWGLRFHWISPGTNSQCQRRGCKPTSPHCCVVSWVSCPFIAYRWGIIWCSFESQLKVRLLSSFYRLCWHLVSTLALTSVKIYLISKNTDIVLPPFKQWHILCHKGWSVHLDSTVSIPIWSL